MLPAIKKGKGHARDVDVAPKRATKAMLKKKYRPGVRQMMGGASKRDTLTGVLADTISEMHAKNTGWPHQIGKQIADATAADGLATPQAGYKHDTLACGLADAVRERDYRRQMLNEVQKGNTDKSDEPRRSTL